MKLYCFKLDEKTSFFIINIWFCHIFIFRCQVNLLDQSKLFYWDWNVKLSLKQKLYKLSPKNNFCLDFDDRQKEQLFAQKVNKKGFFFALAESWQFYSLLNECFLFWRTFCFYNLMCFFLLFKKVDIFTRFLMFFVL